MMRSDGKLSKIFMVVDINQVIVARTWVRVTP